MARAVAVALGAVAVAATSLTLSLLPKTYETALCNDGTQSGYYYAAGTNDVWIIHQQGGDWWVLQLTNNASGRPRCHGRSPPRARP